MTQFIAEQRDYLIFISLFALMLCALASIVLNREEGRERRWLMFFSFYLFESLAILLLLFSPANGPREVIAMLTLFFRALAFGSLFGFNASVTASLRTKWRIVALTLILLSGCYAVGHFRGGEVLTALLLIVLGIPGIVFAIRHLMSNPAAQKPGRSWLVFHLSALCAYVLLALLQAVVTLFFRGALENELLIARGMVSIALGVSLSFHELRSLTRLNRSHGSRITRTAVRGAFLLLPVILVGAWFLVTRLGALSQKQLRAEYLSDQKLLWSAIASRTTEIDRATRIMSSSPLIIDFLARSGDSSRAFAELELDRFSRQMQGTICYLLDRQGMTVASSNRSSPQSFVGYRCADLPNSVNVLAERRSRFFSSGRMTRSKGYYASAPVYAAQSDFLGLVVIRMDVEALLIEAGSYSDVFLVDPDGMIFLSAAKGYSYRALWPISEARQWLILSSGRLGSYTFNPVLKTEPQDASITTWMGSQTLVTRSYLHLFGWSVIHFGSMDETRLFRLGGLLIALAGAILLGAFSAAGQISLLDQQKIERSEARYRSLVEGSPNWISMVDAHGAFLFTNRAGCEGLGILGAVLPERRIENILGSEGVAQIAGQVEISLHGDPVAFESILPSHSGEARKWHITLIPVRTADQEPTAILIGNDVTDLRRAEARLVLAERMAALGTLTGGIAHQFNNINAVALGYIQVLEMELNLSEKTKSYLRSIREALERSVDITSRLLPLSVSQTVKDTPLQLTDEVRAAVASLQGELGREGVAVELNLEEGLTATINREQLVFVLNALLVNAWHAVLGQPKRRVRVITGKKDAEVFLRVEDTGIGIATNRLSSLFTPFYSEKGEHAQPQSPQARVRGVGLSLAVVHSIVAGKAGRIDVESISGVGSTFTVWLPGASEGGAGAEVLHELP